MMQKDNTNVTLVIGVFLLTTALAGLVLGLDLLPVLQIWFAMFLFGVYFFPLTSRLFRSFSDRGWIQSKLIGMSITGFVSSVLILTHTIRFLWAPLAVCTAAVTAVVWAAVIFNSKRRHRDPLRNLFITKDCDLTLILVEELLFFILLVFWCYLYGFEYQAALHSEGPMDYGILSSLMRSRTLPPVDMWDSSRLFNTYYYGCHYFTVYLAKLTGARTNEMFTIGVAMTPAFSFTIVFSIAWHLMRDRKPQGKKAASYVAGLLTGTILMCSGNLHYLVYGLFRLIDFENYNYWSTTRYIGYPDNGPGTITEIPAFSFILGDHHAHIINIMYVCCFLSVLYAWMRSMEARASKAAAEGGAGLPALDELETNLLRGILTDPFLYMAGLFITVFFMNNTWDAPIYVFVCAVATGFMELRSSGEKRFLRWFLRGVVLAVLLFVMSGPFRTSFSTVSSSGLVPARVHTEVEKIFILWGMHLAVIAMFFQYTLYAHRKIRKEKGAVTYIRGLALPDLFVLLAGSCSVVLILFPEAAWVMDYYGGRMNTIFKAYLQSSVLLDTVCGYALCRLMLDARKWPPRVFAGAVLGLFLISCGYFHMGIRDHFSHFPDKTFYYGIDAENSVERELPEDAGGIRWLEENVEGQPHILEASGVEYTVCGRVASLTGLPTILGQYSHEWQFTMDKEDVDRRQADVAAIYTGSNEELVRHLLRQYDIRYIFVGKEEMSQFSVNRSLLQKFGNVVYEDEYGTYILEISKDSL